MQKTAYEITLWIGTNLDEPVVLAAQSQGELRQAIADWARSLAATRFSPESPGARRNQRSTLHYIDEAAITARNVQRAAAPPHAPMTPCLTLI